MRGNRVINGNNIGENSYLLGIRAGSNSYPGFIENTMKCGEGYAQVQV